MTSFGKKYNIEYKHNNDLIQKLDNKIQILKNKRNKKRCRKRTINKYENKKSNLIDELHWKTINDILLENDYIFYGDIKSHNIVKHGKNKNLNKDFNNLKFYLFKQRLIFKTAERNKQIYIIGENFTTKTCSNCGNITNIGNSKIYNCKKCNCIFDRDFNAAKNILMKGITSNL